MLPVGASVCVAGTYLITVTRPTLVAKSIAFSKETLLSQYKWPFLFLAVGQILCGGIAFAAWKKLSAALKRQKLEKERYEGREVEAGKECKICLANPCDVIFQPCKHMCCCKPCSVLVSQCPICRGDVRERISVFIA